MSWFQTAVLVFGYSSLAYYTYRIYSFFYFHLAPKSTLQRYKRQNEKTYALITGASLGLGFAYAQELATRDFGIILLSHIQEELDTAEKRIKDVCPQAHIITLQMDAISATNPEIVTAVDSISNLPITILINNVGGAPIAPPKFRVLSDYALEDIDDSINMNARFMARLSSLMLPLLHRNGPSLLINIASGGVVGLPHQAMYSATKSFVLGLSRSLTRECKVANTKVDCLCIVPGDVLTDGNRLALTPGSPTAKRFAEIAIGRIDVAVSRGMLDMSPFWQHGLQIELLNLLPERIRRDMIVDGMEHKKRVFAKEQ